MVAGSAFFMGEFIGGARDNYPAKPGENLMNSMNY